MALRIVGLEQAGGFGCEVVGGKGRSLGRLMAGGFRVPPGFVITAPALGGSDREPRVALATEVGAALDRLDLAAEPLAVRSSATDEDGADASFAGQYTTVLNVRGAEALWEAIDACLASAATGESERYRAALGAASRAAMAVVVQRMVPAELAGVVFTLDPVTGDRERIVVEAIEGLGDRLVGGQAEAHRVVLDRASQSIVEQQHNDIPVLSSDMATSIARTALQVEQLLGAPQDIEFAVAGGDLWLLQARPITGVAPTAAGAGEFDTPTSDAETWTSANVQEVLPGPLTPMTLSTFRKIARHAYNDAYRQLGLLDAGEEYEFVGLFHNRAFLSVNATRLIAERALGSDPGAVEHRFLAGAAPARKQPSAPLRTWRFRIRSVLPLSRMVLGIHRRTDRAERAVLARERHVRAMRLGTLTDRELEGVRRGLVELGTAVFAIHLQATGCAGGGFDLVADMVRPVLKERTEELLPVFFTGLSGVESAEIGADLWHLSRVALEHGLEPSLAKQTFDPASTALPLAWQKAFAAFLERHGHRGLSEMEPAAATWSQDPSPVIRVVQSYLRLPETQSPPASFARQRAERLRLTRQVARSMNPVTRAIFRAGLERAQGWVALRERTKSIVVRSTRVADQLVPECQRRLLREAVIERPDDMFFLTTDELADFLLGRRQVDLKPRVVARRREMERNRFVRLPERFSGRPSPLPPEDLVHAGGVLTGVPVSPGVVTARARVINDPAADGPLEPGEILVAPVTDAGWTPLFALASGLVVDIGSALSHGSTVAREFGLPAVVNVKNGTVRIKTGDLVTVNGSSGTVTVLAEPPS